RWNPAPAALLRRFDRDSPPARQALSSDLGCPHRGALADDRDDGADADLCDLLDQPLHPVGTNEGLVEGQTRPFQLGRHLLEQTNSNAAAGLDQLALELAAIAEQG